MPRGIYVRTDKHKKNISDSLKGIKRSKETIKKMSKVLRFEKMENGCWIVISHKPNGRGYVSIYRDGKTIRAHRYMYEKYIGIIPRGMFICHKCDSPMCVNPQHLFVGSHTDNMADMVQKGRAARGESQGNATLKARDILKIRDLLKRNVAGKQVAKIFRVTETAISYIKTGKTWSWL